MILASQVPSMAKWAMKKKPIFLVFSLATAVGICLGESDFYVAYWTTPEYLYELRHVFPATPGIVQGMSAAFALLGLPAVFLGVLFFWDRLMAVLRKMNIFSGIRGVEAAIYGLLLVLSLGVMAFSFARSDAFYGTDYLFDIIYSSDSPDLMKQNAFLALTQSENDLRQPLFAVFAAPFIGLPYLLGSLTGSVTVRAILMNAVMVGMLFTAQLMLTRAMKLDRRGRICMMAFLFCTYTQMLFTLMIEQYIVAYFWLTLCILQISERNHPERGILFGAGGSILTSLALLPFLSGHSPWKHPKEWFLDAFRRGLEFLALTLAFCRFDIYYSLGYNIRFLSQFTGEAISLFGQAEPVYRLCPELLSGTADRDSAERGQGPFLAVGSDFLHPLDGGDSLRAGGDQLPLEPEKAEQSAGGILDPPVHHDAAPLRMGNPGKRPDSVFALFRVGLYGAALSAGGEGGGKAENALPAARRDGRGMRGHAGGERAGNGGNDSLRDLPLSRLTGRNAL